MESLAGFELNRRIHGEDWIPVTLTGIGKPYILGGARSCLPHMVSSSEQQTQLRPG
jgi:hypothetical protein